MKRRNFSAYKTLELEMEIHLTPGLAYDGEIKEQQPDGFMKTVPQYRSLFQESEVDRLTSQMAGMHVDGVTTKDESVYYRVLKPETIQFCGFFRGMLEDLSSDSEESSKAPPKEKERKIVTQIVTNADKDLLDLILDFLEHYASLPNSEQWRNDAIEERRKGPNFLPEDEISEWDAARLANFHTWRILQLYKAAEYFDSNLIRMKTTKWLVNHETKGFDDIKLKESFGTNRVFTDDEKEHVRKATGILWL